jgi:signal transduction histidine kinase
MQLQQTLIALVRAGIGAMAGDRSGPRTLTIRTATLTKDEIEVAVLDTGPGMPADHPGRSDTGLSIYRSIIERHGGRLSATGNDPQGTTVRFTLQTFDATERPLATAPDRVDEPTPVAS